jgi:class 3 adenylate cyclase
MGKSWTVSFIVSSVVSLLLLALYQQTGVFVDLAVKLQNFFYTVFILPPEKLKFFIPVQYVFLVVMAFVTALVCLDLPRIFSKVAYLAGAIFLTLLLSPVLAFCGVLFEPFSGAFAIALSGLAGLFLGSTDKGKRQHALLRYFTGRISTEKFNEIVNSKKPVELSGKKDLTVLSCRILNYPELSSQMEPQDLEQMGSLFLRAAAEFLVSKGAYLDSCNAEGVRVYFGMLDAADDNHAVDGCKAALELRQRLINLEQEIQNRWHRKPFFGVSLATGPMTTGLFGFSEFQFYSGVGESLDFSRRLCAINLVYGSHVLINSRTYSLTKEHMEARPMEMVYAPRMHQISEVYELLAAKGSLSDEELKSRDAFWQGVVSLRKGSYPEAVAQLKKAKIEGREDAPLNYFLERAEAGLKDDKLAAAGGGSSSSSDVPTTRSSTRHVRMLTAN